MAKTSLSDPSLDLLFGRNIHMQGYHILKKLGKSGNELKGLKQNLKCPEKVRKFQKYLLMNDRFRLILISKSFACGARSLEKSGN